MMARDTSPCRFCFTIVFLHAIEALVLSRTTGAVFLFGVGEGSVLASSSSFTEAWSRNS